MSYSSHPNPLLERKHWRSLDGTWQFAFDSGEHPSQVVFDREIQVPYAAESKRSGIHDQGFHSVVWYRRTLQLETHEIDSRLLLHFEAVDYNSKVWVNGQLLATHQGGNTPFVAELANTSSTLEILVRAEDEPQDMHKPRGKQDWQRHPHAIWYPRTTGIWQSVWLEVVPEVRIENLRWTANIKDWTVQLDADLAGHVPEGSSLRVQLSVNGTVMVEDIYGLTHPNLSRVIALPDPGIDDARHELFWSPEHPQLIQAQLEILHENTVVDRVSSYTAMREVAVRDGRFILNARPYFWGLVIVKNKNRVIPRKHRPSHAA